MPDNWQLASAFVRFLLYLGVLTSTGLVLIRIVFRRETEAIRGLMAKQAGAFAILALLASGLGFALSGAALTGEASGMTDPELLYIVWRSPAGTAVSLCTAGLAILFAGLCVPGNRPWIAAAGGALALWSFALGGHIADSGNVWLKLLLLVHLAIAAFWVGVLLPLHMLAGSRGNLAQAAEFGWRFGRTAEYAVPILIAAGAVMAWLLLGSVSALVTTGYGVTLLLKVAAVGMLLAGAAANKLRFVPAMRNGDGKAAFALRRTIALEMAAVCIILAATAMLTTLWGAPLLQSE